MPVVGIVFRVHPIRDHENLHILEQGVSGPIAVALIAVDLVERLAQFHAPAFQLNLDQSQPVHQQRQVIAGPVGSVVRDLRRDLIAVAAPFRLVEEFHPCGAAIVYLQRTAITQGLGLVEDIALFPMVQDCAEFPGLEFEPVMCLKLGLQVCGKGRAIRNGDKLSAQSCKAFD